MKRDRVDLLLDDEGANVSGSELLTGQMQSDVPCGQPGGVAMETLEEGAESGFHWMGQTNILSGMMELGGSSSSPGA